MDWRVFLPFLIGVTGCSSLVPRTELSSAVTLLTKRRASRLLSQKFVGDSSGVPGPPAGVGVLPLVVLDGLLDWSGSSSAAETLPGMLALALAWAAELLDEMACCVEEFNA